MGMDRSEHPRAVRGYPRAGSETASTARRDARHRPVVTGRPSARRARVVHASCVSTEPHDLRMSVTRRTTVTAHCAPVGRSMWP
jgi:hypothetical protein